MLQKVSDTRANLNENIVHAAKIIGRSKTRRAVFSAIYYGKKKWKTVSEIGKATQFNNVKVLQAGGRLAHHEIVEQGKVKGRTAYAKDPTLAHHKNKILALAGNPKKQAKIATKQNPHGRQIVRFTVSRSRPQPRFITVDHVASFKRVRSIAKADPKLRLSKLPEERIKLAFQRIIGEGQKFKDWGGEKNDLHTTKLRLKSARVTTAFAFKGKGTSGTLTPGKMGRNGDQVGRLLTSEAEVFFIVYHGKIDQSVHEQMRAFAVAGALGGRSVSYGVIDGDDLNRLHQAYPQHFTRPSRANYFPAQK